MKIALQLYSIRDYTRTPEALRESLAKVAECGYKYVETAGFYGLSAAELKELLASYGLSAVSTHTGFEALVNGFDAVVADHKALGATNVGVPGMPGSMYRHTLEGYAAFGQKLDDYAAKLADAGLTISYHNHAHEFAPVGDSCGWDYIFKNSKLLKMQLDTGNAYEGKAVPEEWLAKFSDRVVTLHYKDKLASDGKLADSAIGEGSLNWKAIAAASTAAKCECVIVEIEQFARDPWDTIKCSLVNIEKMFA